MERILVPADLITETNITAMIMMLFPKFARSRLGPKFGLMALSASEYTKTEDCFYNIYSEHNAAMRHKFFA